MPPGDGTSDSFGAEDAGEPLAHGQNDGSKTLEVQVNRILREQKLKLSKMKKDNASLRVLLEQESASKVEPLPGMSVMAHASRLAAEAEAYTSRVDAEKRRLAGLLADLSKIDARLDQIKEKEDWKTVEIREEKQNFKQQLGMEERLHVLTNRWATFVSENKALRADIEEDRKDHMRFISEKKRLQEALQQTECSVQEITAATREVFEERAKLTHDIAERRARREAEQKTFVGQCRELNQVLIAFEESERMMHSRSTLPSLDSGPLGNMSLDQEEQLQRKLSNWRAGFSKDKSKADKQKDRADALNDAMQRIQDVTGLNGIDEFISRFLQFEESNFRAFETHNGLVAEINRSESQLALLHAQAAALQAAIDSGDSAAVEHMLQMRDINELKRVEELGQAFESGGNKREELLQQVVAGVHSVEKLVETLEGPQQNPGGQHLWQLADLFRKLPLSERSVLQHLADLESFCTRVQVLLQHREKEKLEVLAPKRSNSVDGKDGDEDDAEQNEVAEACDSGKSARTVAAVKRAAAADETARSPPAVMAISVPDIRDDDDSYFGDEVDVPVELSTLRSQVMKARSRRMGLTAAQAASVPAPLAPTPLSPSRTPNSPAIGAATPKSKARAASVVSRAASMSGKL